MSMAQSVAPGFFAPLQGLWRWFKPASTPGRAARSGLQQRARSGTRHSSAAHDDRLMTQPHLASHAVHRKPLRVLRVMEAGQPSALVGRMVISGCMADVCAELDRLAACEALLH